MRELIPGYEATIHMALWQRILTWGVPRLWFITGVAGTVFLAFCVYSLFHSWRLSLIPIVLGGLGLLGLRALTWWDVDFDSVLAHSLRYRSYYEAG